MDCLPKNFEHDDNTREFMKLLVSNQRNIHAFIMSMVPHKNDSEDIMQETFTEMWKKFDQYEPGTNFAGWGITIAKFKVLNFRRKTNKSKLQFNDELLGLLVTESENRLDAMDDRIGALQECTKKLSSKELRILRLRYEDDMTFRQIASIYGYSHQAVCKAVSLIHARLAQCVRSRGVL